MPVDSGSSSRPRRGIAWVSLFLFALALLAESIYCFSHPVAYLDTMAYVSLAQGGASDSFRQAGQRCGAELPGIHNGCDVVAQSDMFGEAARLSESDFSQFLRFYTVKPLYVAATRMLGRAFGMSPFGALRWISAGSFLLLGLLLRSWLRRWTGPVAASVLALCLVSSPQTLALGRGLLPDGMLTLTLLAGAWLLLRPDRMRWVGAVLLLAATLVRPDAVLFGGMLAGVLVWRQAASSRVRWTKLGYLAIALAAWMLLLGRMTHALPWRVQFVHAFLAWTPPADYAGLHVSVAEYARVLLSNGVRTLVFCLPVSLFLAALAFYRCRGRSSMRMAAGAGLAALVVRVALFPGVEDRYYVWFFLLAGLGAAEALTASAYGAHPDAVCQHPTAG